jgi:hypothetical protein
VEAASIINAPFFDQEKGWNEEKAVIKTEESLANVTCSIGVLRATNVNNIMENPRKTNK